MLLEAFKDSELSEPYEKSDESPVTVTIDNNVVPPAVVFNIDEGVEEGFRSEIWFKGSTVSGASDSFPIPVTRCGKETLFPNESANPYFEFPMYSYFEDNGFNKIDY